MIRARWPDGPRCPRCAGADAAERSAAGAGRRRRWRCRRCRYDFGVTSGTRLHGSKAPLASWVACALGTGTPDGAPPAATSRTTGRRIREAVESTGLPPGPARLAAMLTHQPDQEPPPGPLAGLARGPRLVLAMLRTRLAGATATQVAAETGLSQSHVRRCLRELRRRGFAECEETAVMWGYEARRERLWRLRMSEQTLRALAQIGWTEPSDPPDPPAKVPPEFWYLFWSGQCASRLTLAQDALHVADTLMGGANAAARAWALASLPLETLTELRSMRGYDYGMVASWLDLTIEERSHG